MNKSNLKYLTLAAIATSGFVAYSTFGAGVAHISSSSGAPNPTEYQLAKAEPLVKRLLLLMDADNNNKVSKQEFMNYMSQEFDNLDVNKSGYLDIAELKKLSVSQPHPGGGSK
jgi:hypothetical protein